MAAPFRSPWSYICAAFFSNSEIVLPEVAVVDDLHSGRLCRLLIDYPSQIVPVHIVYPSRRNLAPRTRVVLDFVVEQSREIQALLAAGTDVVLI